MVVCKKCGTESPDETVFCPSCGTRLSGEPEVEKTTTPTIIPVKANKIDEQNYDSISRAHKLDERKKTKEQREKDKKERAKIASAESPHMLKQHRPSSKTYILPIAVLALLIVVVAVVVFSRPLEEPCIEDWDCSEWVNCTEGKTTRTCLDLNECGTSKNALPLEQDCTLTDTVPVVNMTENITSCADFGEYCEVVEDCCAGNCNHHMCINGSIYCGDAYCDPGEDCNSCPYDCGECSADRELVQNVFTDPLLSNEIEQYEADGYVVVTYVYKESCVQCFEPVHIENQLRDLAANFKDIFVLQILDLQEHNFQASKYANMGMNTYTPMIVVDRIKLYGTNLGIKLQDGDITVDIAEVICQNSNYCNFENNKIVKTSP